MYTLFIHFHTVLMIELLFMQSQINDRNLNRVTVNWWERRSWSAQLGGLWFVCRQGQKICLLSKTARQAMGSTQHPIQWVPHFFSGGQAVHHILMLSMNGAIPVLHICA